MMDIAVMENGKMYDLISRLSELRCQYNCFDENERDAYHTLSEAIKALSDVPDTNVGDMISRREAICALEEPCKVPDTWTDEYAVGERMQWEKDVKALNSLPSADVVEVVRCKNCAKYQKKYRWCDLHGDSMELNDFCSCGERKDD